MTRRRAMWLMLIAALASGCNPASPSPPNLSGTWDGTMTVFGGSDVSVQMTFMQTETAFSGTWNVSGLGGSFSGPISGGFVNTSGSVTFNAGIDGVPFCTYQFTGSVDGSRITGRYINFACAVFEDGSFTLRRR